MEQAVIEPGTQYFRPNLDALRQLSETVAPATPEQAELWLSGIYPEMDLEMLACLLKAMLTGGNEAIARLVCERGAQMRQHLFGNAVVPMAPIEVSNTCASDCVFCGWRLSNRAMKRLKMPAELAMRQVEYLVDQGIHYIEFVSGDDIAAVRDLFPELIAQTRSLFKKRGVQGKVSFCTLALTEKQYADLKAAGADNMIVWQEAYDPKIFAKHVVGGPKAFGISDDWKVTKGGDGCGFRIESQERAMRAGLEVALGSMLGLNPDVVTEFLATVVHARYLAETYGATPEHPIIIGMPVWNAITTKETDLRPADTVSMQQLFPALAALYLLALPSAGTWVFPNCRVPMKQQIEAARVAGAFSSTEVKLGPGGYLPVVIREMRERGENTSALVQQLRGLLREAGEEVSLDQLQRMLDEREQFVHHYHAHAAYRDTMAAAGLELVDGVRIQA
jgi:2-iminoacetate synthase ThiH